MYCHFHCTKRAMFWQFRTFTTTNFIVNSTVCWKSWLWYTRNVYRSLLWAWVQFHWTGSWCASSWLRHGRWLRLLARQEQLGHSVGRRRLHQDGPQQGQQLWSCQFRQLPSSLISMWLLNSLCISNCLHKKLIDIKSSRQNQILPCNNIR